MNVLAEFALGLGIFFVGMQMVGEHLRQLSGPSFRALVARSTSSPWSGVGLGLVAGAMMQSATGVTFILVNMVTAGLISAQAALPVIAWSNVGLTALAFVVTLDIHPLVAGSVGVCGIAATLIRQRTARQVANVLLGVALLLFGLQSMGAAAVPLKETQELRTAVQYTVTSPALAFVAGFLLAALLQSNTGATMLVITLAAQGMFGLPTAAMLIYGTNLGAIVLRLLLSIDMRGVPRQLVRFEDAFCLASGLLMVALFFIERVTGLPLVLAGVAAATDKIALQLALVFLLANLLPAIVVMPALGPSLAWLARRWPADEVADAAQPEFLTPQSLDDPASAVDLIPRELARLLTSLQCSVRTHRAGTDTSDVEDQRAADYAALTARIDEYAAQLSTRPLQKSVAQRLNATRELTALVGYLAESYVQLRHSHRALRHFPDTAAIRDQILAALELLLGIAATAVDTRQPAAIAHLREQSRSRSVLIEQARLASVSGATGDDTRNSRIAERTATQKLLADFELSTWIIHRISKLLDELTPQASGAAPRSAPKP
ncbi:MAG TPA: Na/Pi symporter [Pirellulales bacterium]|nr:Na/Pi symporter [Pirellulales bacterium]